MGACQNIIRKKKVIIKSNIKEKGKDYTEKEKPLQKSPNQNFIIYHNFDIQYSNYPTAVSDGSPQSKIFPKTPSSLSSNTSTIMTIPYMLPTSNFILEATLGETEIPIYVEKNDNFSIIINQNNNNNISQEIWSFIQNEKPVDYLGYSNYQYNNINLGALLLRISGSEKIYHLNKNFNTIKAESKGSILISANLDQNNYLMYEPKGVLIITVNGGKYLDEKELNLKEHINNINQINSNYILKEKKLLKYINKARNDPQKFINEYFMSKEINKDLVDFVNNNSYKRNELELSEELNSAAQNHCEDLCNNATSGNIGTDGSTFSDRINKYYHKCVNIGENITYETDNPLLIVKKMIQDNYSKTKNNRNNIFCLNYNKIGICIRKHLVYKFCCVIVFSE